MAVDIELGLIEQAALDYFEGWYAGDVARMDRALHPDLIKRWAGDQDGVTLGRSMTKDRMLAATANGGGAAAVSDQDIAVTVVDVHHEIASAVVRSKEYREYLHLVRTPDGWKIVNAFWRNT